MTEAEDLAFLREWTKKARATLRDVLDAFSDSESVGGWHTSDQGDALREAEELTEALDARGVPK